jgi:hypothetical protein
MTKWLRFLRSDPEKARRISELALIVAPLLHNQKPDEQVEILQQHEECRELHELLKQHKDVFALQDNGYAYVAFILGLGYCAVMRTEGRSVKT